MDYKNLDKDLIVRLLGLVLAIILLVNSFYGNINYFNSLIFLLLVVFVAFTLYLYFRRKDKDLEVFLESFDPFSEEITENEDRIISRLREKMVEVATQNISPNENREEEFQYMTNIIQHVGIGLITFNKKGDVQLINTAARNILQTEYLHNISELSGPYNRLVESFKKLRTGGKDLIRVEVNGEVKQLAIFAIQLTKGGQEYKLISLQNIHYELEEKEMEAWQNLVRVLTHEIMNSITPITSLSSLVEDELSADNGKLEPEDLEDVLSAVTTIKRRSSGLVKFVQDFRSLTHVPQPKLHSIKIKDLFGEAKTLLKSDIKKGKIEFLMDIDPEDLEIYADKSMIDQVLINLLKNAFQAFDEENESKKINLSAYNDKSGRPVISVKDNASGIEKEALEKIFIPFFTTKNKGSGIGLSLSRQIMRKHNGVLAVKSEIDKGTEFFMKF